MVFKKIKKKFSFLRYLDPFYYIDTYIMPKINPNDNEVLNWIVYLASALVLAFVIYSAFGLLLHTESPMVIVVSGSMEPVYHRGDVIVLAGTIPEAIAGAQVFTDRKTLEGTPLSEFAMPLYELRDNSPHISSLEFEDGTSLPITTEGDVVVYFSGLRYQPIIHRVVAKLHADDGWYVLTKGDSERNRTIDQDCGQVQPGAPPSKSCISLYPIKTEELDGKAILQIPLIGCVKLWLFDNISSLVTTGALPSDFRGIC